MKRTTTKAAYHSKATGPQIAEIEGYATPILGLTIHRPHEFNDGVDNPPTHISQRYWVLTATCGYCIARYFPRRKDALAFAEEIVQLFPEIDWQTVKPDFVGTEIQRQLAQQLMNKWRRNGFRSLA